MPLVPSAGKPPPESAYLQPPAFWQRRMDQAIAYARGRNGQVMIALRLRGHLYGYHATNSVPSASVLKAMLLVAYLNMGGVRDRDLTDGDRQLLAPMIRWSDNAAASQVDAIVGDGRLQALASRVGMTRFVAVSPIWGNSLIDARDQSQFFLNIDRYIVPRHRAYGMALLASVIGPQRWGIARAAPRGWQLYFKGGWGSGTGRVDHQVALLEQGSKRVALAILTVDDGTHAYGKETLRGVAARLLGGL